MISVEKWMILAHCQKLPNNVGDLDKIIVALNGCPKYKKLPNLVTLQLTVLSWRVVFLQGNATLISFNWVA